MTDTVGQRVQRYMLDGSDEDLRRLLGIAEVMAESAATALRRSGIGPGWNVIECGCGPLGALPVLAELTGPGGRVTGVDFTPGTVAQARAAVAALGLDAVRVVEADVGELDPADPVLGAPFDVAFTRAFLMHQADPVRILRRIAGLLRPGGWIIAQEALRRPPPRSFPPLDALGASWGMAYAVMEGFGAPADAGARLPAAAAAAGLQVVRLDGSFTVGRADRMFGLHAAGIAAIRERGTAAGLASGADFDAFVGALRTAIGGGYEWATSPFFLDLTLRVPRQEQR